ncbi:putative Serine/threonine-protein kinase haspin [Hypsibius exemplaris]|uniref:non-specific serine/threonine protein kinase n=1 Tax=Hypsibius exemplaris TaxID=2072580 RepID=A0A1W0WDJ3_HYPEX|nr:putative Serine/threonine-protein kinase haspin [Hypsibius exemplaris]
MFSKGATYGRRPLGAARVRSEADEQAAAFFGPPKKAPPVPSPSVVRPSPSRDVDDDDDSSDGSRDSLRCAKRTRKSAKKAKFAHRKSQSHTAELDDAMGELARHTREESISSKLSDRLPPSIFSEASGPSRKRQRKKAATPLSEVGSSSRPDKPRRRKQLADDATLNPANDPEYQRFLDQMKDLEGHTLHVQDQDEYWREVKGNEASEFDKLVSTTRSQHTTGYSLFGHQAREEARKAKHVTAAALMPRIDETHESDFEDETPVESTPLVNQKKRQRRRSPQVSHIKERSPLRASTSFVRPSSNGKTGRGRGGARRTIVPRAVSPDEPAVSKRSMSRQAKRPAQPSVATLKTTSPDGEFRNLSEDFDAVLRDDLPLDDVEDERFNIIPTEDGHLAASLARAPRPAKSPINEHGKIARGSVSHSRSSIRPNQLSTSTAGERSTAHYHKDQRKESTAEPSLLLSPSTSSLLVSPHHGNVFGEASEPPSGASKGNPSTPLPSNLSTSYSSQPRFPSTPIPADKRRRRDSLPVFSPATFASQEDRRILSQAQATRSARRSVVISVRNHKAPTLSARDQLLAIATPPRIIHTDGILGNDYVNLTKIGEGSYADVYSAYCNGEEIVMKIVPINGFYRTGEQQTSYEDILSESLISVELTRLMNADAVRYYAPVFARTFFIKIARGPYPDAFSNRHDSFARENEGDALNQHPVSYEEGQHYVVIGLNNGGRDLENFPIANHRQAKSIFQQVALGLAVAEEALEFEHRDAHISNILVKLTKDASMRFRLGDEEYIIPTEGVQATIIDWTLSRMKSGDKVVYKDLAKDEAIFRGRGVAHKPDGRDDDGVGDEQYDVYRDMRARNSNDWQAYQPSSNVRWLTYLQHKLLKKITTGGRAKARKDLLDLGDPKTKAHPWPYTSAADLVRKVAMFAECLVVPDVVDDDDDAADDDDNEV